MSLELRLSILSLASLTLIGCAHHQSAPSPSVPPRDAVASCNTEGLAQFSGQKATAELGAKMLQHSGAKRLRWVPPRTAVTMDFRPDRLTVRYDDAMHIIRANCG